MTLPVAGSTTTARQSLAGQVWLEVVGAVGLYGLVSLLFLVVPGLLLHALGVSLEVRGRTAVALGGTLLGELVVLRLLVAWLHRHQRSLADLGWGRPTTKPALLLGLVFGLAYAAYTLGNPAIGAHAAELGPLKVWGAGVGLFGGVVEEIVFRGFVLAELDRIRTPVWLQVLVSGVAFGLLHAGFSPVGMASTFVMGLVLAVVYRLGRRSLTPVALSHAVINLLIEPWLLLFIISVVSTGASR